MTKIIEFSDVYGKYLGRAVLKDGTLTGSNLFAEDMISTYFESAQTNEPEKFIERFAGWTNGYIQSELLPE